MYMLPVGRKIEMEIPVDIGKSFRLDCQHFSVLEAGLGCLLVRINTGDHGSGGAR
jgi:hypothetical protein